VEAAGHGPNIERPTTAPKTFHDLKTLAKQPPAIYSLTALKGGSMSGIVNQILGGLMGGAQGNQSTALTGILQQVLSSNGGGVASLMSRFEAAGLGSHAQSWVSTGENMPASADQIGKVFSAEEI
jgi:uncharacterized protein YidB (DUF937 family)